MVTASSSRSKSPPPLGLWPLSSAELHVIVLTLCIKILLFPAYRSTDFDVHRNWLRITNDLPLSKWYYDDQSEWTLDYPPFFAYFEKALSLVARHLNRSIASLEEVTPAAVLFQRASVIASEVVLVWAALLYARTFSGKTTSLVLMGSLIAHPAFVIIDSIHFQYNGFLFGLLILSLFAAQKGQYNTCAAFFAILLNYKHIFMYISLPFFVFLLRAHCFESGRLHFNRVIQLGLIVISICALSFGPFVLVGGVEGLQQIISRLFPFQRGLNHAYWAPNAWSLYTLLDRILIKVYQIQGLPVDALALHSASKGLIGDTHFGVLPNITPRMCFGITLACNIVGLTKLWIRPTYTVFIRSVAFSAYVSFLFGWHVHEKAVLLFLIPLTLISPYDHFHFTTFMVASTASIFALFPLLIHTDETLVKLSYSLLWGLLIFPAVEGLSLKSASRSSKITVVTRAERLYLGGFAVLWLLTSPLSAAYSAIGKEFVPLMATSVYCSIGVCWSFLRLCWSMLVV